MAEKPFKVAKGQHHDASDFVQMMSRRFKEELEDRSEMHLQVGRTIVALSDIEQYLESFFALFSLPMAEEQSSRMFYSKQNFSSKLGLVDYAMLRSAEKELHKPWIELSERIKQQKVVRNLAAHASIHFKSEKGATRSRVVISASSQGGNSKNELGIPDVRKAADELEAIKRDMIKFFNRALRVITNARNIDVEKVG
ncbi:hypothetical protein [Rhodopseudomonas palustris]|uniref:Uncharacterized protein n=1 Tax=Rhodopseudomonas palustris (strain BisB18) TaxID=316056 RepID=Q213U5_RHOPB